MSRCGECLHEIHPQSLIDYMGTSVRHKNRSDCFYAIRAESEQLLRERDRATREQYAKLVLDYERHYQDEECSLTVKVLLDRIAAAIREFDLHAKPKEPA